jgi:hypothetical protein
MKVALILLLMASCSQLTSAKPKAYLIQTVGDFSKLSNKIELYVVNKGSMS